MRTRPVIAIDGPVGAGKSTVARELALSLGYEYLNTGAMYRAVAVAARYNGIAPDNPALDSLLENLLKSIAISFENGRVMLSGRNISAEIGDPQIGDLASQLSTRAVVRNAMRDLQRAAGSGGGIVIEGRDIGTAVFPDAEFKFFLTADIGVRADRRFAELASKGVAITRDEVLRQLQERDSRDRARELAPLKCADDAIVIDSTALSANQVVHEMKTHVQSRTRGVKDLKRD